MGRNTSARDLDNILCLIKFSRAVLRVISSWILCLAARILLSKPWISSMNGAWTAGEGNCSTASGQLDSPPDSECYKHTKHTASHKEKQIIHVILLIHCRSAGSIQCMKMHVVNTSIISHFVRTAYLEYKRFEITKWSDGLDWTSSCSYSDI